MKSNKRRSRFLVLCVAPATILFFIFMILRIRRNVLAQHADLSQ